MALFKRPVSAGHRLITLKSLQQSFRTHRRSIYCCRPDRSHNAAFTGRAVSGVGIRTAINVIRAGLEFGSIPADAVMIVLLLYRCTRSISVGSDVFLTGLQTRSSTAAQEALNADQLMRSHTLIHTVAINHLIVFCSCHLQWKRKIQTVTAKSFIYCERGSRMTRRFKHCLESFGSFSFTLMFSGRE